MIHTIRTVTVGNQESTTGVFKVVRIGNNSDHYLREKKVFAYDYINKKILTK